MKGEKDLKNYTIRTDLVVDVLEKDRLEKMKVQEWGRKTRRENDGYRILVKENAEN